MIDSIITAIYSFIRHLGYSHPLHPTQVHLPIGLIFGAFILGILGRLRHHTQFSHAAWYCLVIAMFFTIPTVITGWMDWRHFLAGTLFLPFKIKIVLASLLLVLLIVGYFMGRGNSGTARGLVSVYVASLLTVVVLGYYGGELVFSSQKSQMPENYQAGLELYMENCNACHADGGNIVKPDAPVRHSLKTADYDTFLLWVRTPSPPMPAYPDSVLTDMEVRELYNYVANAFKAP